MAVVDLFPQEQQEESATFGQFWKLYPKKMKRPDAEVAWAKLRPCERRRAIEAIPAHVQMWIEDSTARQFIPLPSSWLNGKRFLDELDVELPEQVDCRWPGCKSIGRHERGNGKYCDNHMAALKRGETPGCR